MDIHFFENGFFEKKLPVQQTGWERWNYNAEFDYKIMIDFLLRVIKFKSISFELQNF